MASASANVNVDSSAIATPPPDPNVVPFNQDAALPLEAEEVDVLTFFQLVACIC